MHYSLVNIYIAFPSSLLEIMSGICSLTQPVKTNYLHCTHKNTNLKDIPIHRVLHELDVSDDHQPLAADGEAEHLAVLLPEPGDAVVDGPAHGPHPADEGEAHGPGGEGLGQPGLGGEQQLEGEVEQQGHQERGAGEEHLCLLVMIKLSKKIFPQKQ